MNYIDAHVHIWTPDLAHYPLAAAYKREDMKPPSFTPDELFKHCKPAGVNRINLIQMSFYGYDNSYMLDMMKFYEDAFVGTAVIDPHDPNVGKLMGEQARKKVRAYRILPGLTKKPAETWLQDPGYDRMFEAGAKNNQAMSCLINPNSLTEVERMCEKFPETPVIIDHLCRIGVSGEVSEPETAALCALAKHKRVLVKVGAFYALGKKKAPYTDLGPLIQQVVKAFGPNRCMWESDCPYQVVSQKYQDGIDLIRVKLDFLSAEDRDWLLRKTAESFLFKNQKVGV